MEGRSPTERPGASEPRKHHYVPAFYLAGFTEEGSQDGRLRAIAKSDGRIFGGTPRTLAHQRDLYRVERLPCANCFSVFMPLTVRSRLQGSQPVGNLLNASGVQRRSVRYRGCWTPPPAACQTPRRPAHERCWESSNRSAVFRVCGSPQPRYCGR